MSGKPSKQRMEFCSSITFGWRATTNMARLAPHQIRLLLLSPVVKVVLSNLGWAGLANDWLCWLAGAPKADGPSAFPSAPKPGEYSALVRGRGCNSSGGSFCANKPERTRTLTVVDPTENKQRRSTSRTLESVAAELLSDLRRLPGRLRDAWRGCVGGRPGRRDRAWRQALQRRRELRNDRRLQVRQARKRIVQGGLLRQPTAAAHQPSISERNAQVLELSSEPLSTISG